MGVGLRKTGAKIMQDEFLYTAARLAKEKKMAEWWAKQREEEALDALDVDKEAEEDCVDDGDESAAGVTVREAMKGFREAVFWALVDCKLDKGGEKRERAIKAAGRAAGLSASVIQEVEEGVEKWWWSSKHFPRRQAPTTREALRAARGQMLGLADSLTAAAKRIESIMGGAVGLGERDEGSVELRKWAKRQRMTVIRVRESRAMKEVLGAE